MRTPDWLRFAAALVKEIVIAFSQLAVAEPDAQPAALSSVAAASRVKVSSFVQNSGI